MADEHIPLDLNQPYPRAWAIVSIFLGFFALATGIYALFFLGCLLLSKGTYRDVPRAIRNQSYNAYLIFLIIPDAQLNLTTGIAKIYEGFNDGKYTRSLCLARNGSNYFYYFANLWLNAVVAHQVYRMFVFSHQRRKTAPPTMRTALTQIAAVYFCCGMLTAWAIADVSWSPYKTTDELYCHTNVGSDTINKWGATAIAFLIVMPPVAYVTYLYWIIWKRKLLPKSGRTRALFVYFLRILIVYFVFYLPNASLAVVYMHLPNTKRTAQFWTLYVFTLLIPLQCIVTIRMACAKEDIGQALSNTKNFVSKRVSSAFSSSRSFDVRAASVDLSSTLQPANERGPSSETPLPDSKGRITATASTSSRGVPTISEWDLEDTYEDTAEEHHEGDEEQANNDVDG